MTDRKSNSRQENLQDFEGILEYLGGFGKCQFLVVVLLLSIEIPAAFLSIVPVFVGTSPDPTSWTCNGETVNNEKELCTCNGTLNPSQEASSTSIVAEWSLICESAWASDFITSIQLAGMISGNLIISILSDWYGRRYTFLGANLFALGGSVLSAVSSNPYIYCFARFISGSAWAGSLALSGVYTMEFLPAKWRHLSASFGPFGEGVMIYALIAYYIRSWRILMWISAVPYLITIIIFWIVPESPRWLLRNKRIEEAQQVLHYIARFNGIESIELNILQDIAEKENPTPQNGDDEIHTTPQRSSFLDFFRYKELRLPMFCLVVIWSSWSLSYFGITYNMKNQPGSPYLNIMFVGLADALGFPSFLLTANYLGRRRSVFFFSTICSVFLFAIALMFLTVDTNAYAELILFFSIIGKYGLAGERSAARLLTGETFPTSIRTMGVGIVACATGTTGFLAPQLVYLGTQWPAIPFFSFALISICGSLCAFLMNETSGKPLTDEILQKKIMPKTKNPILSSEKFAPGNE